VSPRAWNWRLWVGFLICLLSPFAFFSLFEITRSAVWISVALFVIAAVLIVGGLQRTYSAPESYRGRIAGPIVVTLSVLVMALFAFGMYEMKKAYPVAKNAPQVGQKAPEFALTDSNNKNVKLAELLSAPLSESSGSAPARRGVLLVFYRGYW